jgi:hypothetical protein
MGQNAVHRDPLSSVDSERITRHSERAVRALRVRFGEVDRVEASGTADWPAFPVKCRAPELPHPKKGRASGLEYGRTLDDIHRYQVSLNLTVSTLKA